MVNRIFQIRQWAIVGCVLLSVRLVQLQLVQGERYRQLSEQNRLRVLPEAAPRGLILDREGRELASNQTAFRVSAIPQELPKIRKGPGGRQARDRVFQRLGELVGIRADELEDTFDEHTTTPFLPAQLVSQVPKPVALRIEEEHLTLPGITVESVITRRYPMGSVAAHVLGYLSQPSPEQFPVLKQYGVRQQDLVGRSGLEAELDPYLRGQPGGELIEVDHRARQVRVVGAKQTLAGETVTLTIDAELQALIEHGFGLHPGAAVVLRPQTGEVLAMVSAPSFEPQAFAEQNSKMIRRLLEDPETPLMNRAVRGAYLPGSIIKPMTGMVALRNDVITPDTIIVCPGYVEFGDRKIHCWKRDGHGPVRLREALMGSCNVYFMEVARRLGQERLCAGFAAVGYGRKTGWLLGELAGHLPTRRLGEGEVAMLGIGQGEVLVTPIQAASIVSAIANGGWLPQPWVVQRIGDHEAGRPNLLSLDWSPDHVAAIKAGMFAVVNDPQGTGIRAHSYKIKIAAKTGTAQTHVPGRTHGWVIGYCPADDPQLAFAIIAEFGGSGGDLPASIAKTVCEHLVAPVAADAQPANAPAPAVGAPVLPVAPAPAASGAH